MMKSSCPLSVNYESCFYPNDLIYPMNNPHIFLAVKMLNCSSCNELFLFCCCYSCLLDDSPCNAYVSSRLLVVQESLRTDRCDATHHRLICSLSFYCPSRPSFFDHNANFTTLSSLKFLHRHCNYLPNINSCAIHRSYGCLNGSSYGMKIALIVLLRDSLRCLHTTTLWCREETKVEKTVKALRTRLEEEEEEDADKIGAGRQKIQAVNGNQSVASGKDKRTIWRRVVNECKHYYNGFRLLFIDIKVCSRLIWRLLIGGSLTRRERQQVVVVFIVGIVCMFMICWRAHRVFLCHL